MRLIEGQRRKERERDTDFNDKESGRPVLVCSHEKTKRENVSRKKADQDKLAQGTEKHELPYPASCKTIQYASETHVKIDLT